ncbi:hypothetical protein SAMN05216312_1198 [Cohnella sp. OV330]|nr:hypothetical protein SAMN05216312_1198 [Cohnella sp. OV330]
MVNKLNSKTLSALLQLESELEAHFNFSLEENMGIMIRHEEGQKYDCTPDDAKVFAFTGVDGDHFAFSTENGTITDLDNAPILFIQPMCFEDSVKAVARNIRDFLSLFLSLKELYILERFDWYTSIEDMLVDIEDHYEESINERAGAIKFLTERLEEHLQIKAMENVFDYVMSVRKGAASHDDV